AGLKGVDWLEPRTPLPRADLAAAGAAQGVKGGSGELLFVRPGHPKDRAEKGPSPPPTRFARLPADWLPFPHERGVAELGGGTGSEGSSSGHEQILSPIHVVGIVAMGLWLIDNCNHEELAATCRRLGRWEFLVSVAPLKLRHGTGCPVNPIALL